jgi:hypothetical protein
MEEYFGMFVKEVYVDSELTVIFLEKADILAAYSTIIDTDNICE